MYYVYKKDCIKIVYYLFIEVALWITRPSFMALNPVQKYCSINHRFKKEIAVDSHFANFSPIKMVTVTH